MPLKSVIGGGNVGGRGVGVSGTAVGCVGLELFPVNAGPIKEIAISSAMLIPKIYVARCIPLLCMDLRSDNNHLKTEVSYPKSQGMLSPPKRSFAGWYFNGRFSLLPVPVTHY
jgi:hypothetical protein